MHHYLRYTLFLCLSLWAMAVWAQDNNFNSSAKFTIRGSVVHQDSREPIANVNVQVNGGFYTTTNVFGEFRVEARKGDELILRHKDFETVYHIIQNDDRILVEVEPNENDDLLSQKLKTTNRPQFNWYIDSAAVYLKKDAKKSIQFVAEALEISSSKKENGDAYEVLGDIYKYWKQYDLAISNYRVSLENNVSNDVKLKLARAYMQNNNFQESLQEYNSIKDRDLSNYQKVTRYEGLGDVYKNINELDSAEEAYNDGLKIAQRHVITPKITDLNSKIAEVLNSKGAVQDAEVYFEKSLKLASTENKKRAVEEKVKVADFQNEVNNYTDEIALRKQALQDINAIEADSAISNESALTSQKQNYKIGNAYAQKRDFQNAIEYLEKSIKEAEKREDLVVKKDATRKLSEVYESTGEFNKALLEYQRYVDVVDELYRKREQEISHAARFSKDLVTKQNRITSLESDRELSESKYLLTTEQSKRQKIIIYSLIGGVFLLMLTAFLMYKYIRQQRLANNLLALKSLRSQMNPHFIFNALNSVNSFIASNDERAANKYLTDFSKLMRAVLENSEEDFIPLEKEIELIKLYTQLEHFRFQDKFDYTICVDDGILLNDFMIPPMLLQPYIENAVWHGLRYKKEKGHLDIQISKESERELKITITDDGIGREQSKALKTKHQKKQNSKGMGNIKKRVAILNEMYKDKVDVSVADFQDAEDAGTKVVVTLKKD